ncbi:MAG: sulfotransferase family protein [Cyanobacteria bacterium P01_F01_bin.33]
MISEKYKCIFIHIPKTAGQSIENFFLKLHDLTWDERAQLLLRYNPDPALGPESLAHLKASEYTGLDYISCEDFQSYFKFAFVRNPWSRLVSEYLYRNLDKKTSFKDYVMYGLPPKDSYNDKYRHIEPQYNYLHNGSGNLMVDFVGKFESLQTDFDKICASLDILDSKLPHVNASKKKSFKSRIKKIISTSKLPKKHYAEYYDEELKDIVGKIFAKDISAFNYTFQ